MSRIGNLFLKADADGGRLPVLLMSGFLGSGKTTLVNALLREPAMARTAVAVNEFGAVPIDADLIDHGAEKTVVMANGCLCCNLAGDMEEAVMRLFTRVGDGALPGFERLIIEPSGLADPAPIAQAILRNPMMARALRLEGIVTTVDSVFVRSQIARHPETAKQIAMADRLVLTKSDLVSEDERRAVLSDVRRLNDWAPISVATHGGVKARDLLPARFLDPDAVSETDALPVAPTGFLAEDTSTSGDARHVQSVIAVVLTTEHPLNWRAFDAWLKSVRLTWSEQLLRVKGILWIADAVGPISVHGVHHVMHAPVELADWPKGGRGSRLVLIVDIVIANNIRDSWETSLPALIANVAA